MVRLVQRNRRLCRQVRGLDTSGDRARFQAGACTYGSPGVGSAQQQTVRGAALRAVRYLPLTSCWLLVIKCWISVLSLVITKDSNYCTPSLLRWTSNTAISAGVTPAIRDAWPTVCGLKWASFCLASVL